jgi:SOS response regulatory protein OraA/RecX
LDNPLFIWSLKADYAAKAKWTLFDLQDKLRQSGWMVPAYTMPKDIDDMTVMRIVVRHGFSRDIASSTVEECVRLGYINEDAQLERFILRYYEQLLGPKKIIAKLASRSYSAAQISKAIRSLEAQEKIDFAQSKKRLIREKLDEGASYEERLKLLYKYGYTK